MKKPNSWKDRGINLKMSMSKQCNNSLKRGENEGMPRGRKGTRGIKPYRRGKRKRERRRRRRKSNRIEGEGILKENSGSQGMEL